MSYVSEKIGNRRALDADGHLMEDFFWFYPYVEPGVRERLPSPEMLMASAAEGMDFLNEVGHQVDPWLSAEDRADDAANHLMETKHFDALGAFDPAGRSRALDLLGVERQIIFPTVSFSLFDPKASGRPPGLPDDREILYGGARGLNRAMAEFCASDSRMIGTGYVPLEDPAMAVAALDQALKLGCGAIYISHAVPDERSWSHPDYDPVWARISEAGVPIVLHIGTGDKTLELPPAVYNNGRDAFWALGPNTYQTPDFLSAHWPAELMLIQLVMDGVFERFPGLRVGVVELRAAWVPSLLERLDWYQGFAYSNPTYRDDYKLPLRASDYIRRQVKFTPWAEGGEPLASMIDGVEGGERLFLFSTDYPHSEGGEDPIGVFEAELDKLSHRADIEAVRDRFYHGNFEELFGA